jgi:hypothetical protein
MTTDESTYPIAALFDYQSDIYKASNIKIRHLWVKKATGLGITELRLSEVIKVRQAATSIMSFIDGLRYSLGGIKR